MEPSPIWMLGWGQEREVGKKQPSRSLDASRGREQPNPNPDAWVVGWSSSNPDTWWGSWGWSWLHGASAVPEGPWARCYGSVGWRLSTPGLDKIVKHSQICLSHLHARNGKIQGAYVPHCTLRMLINKIGKLSDEKLHYLKCGLLFDAGRKVTLSGKEFWVKKGKISFDILARSPFN